MASGSSASSMMFNATTGTADNMELMANSRQDLNAPLPNPWFSAPQNYFVAPQQDQDAILVINVPPSVLLDTNRFVCELCYKGFAREQNLTLHRRTHNLHYTLKTEKSKGPVPKKVYPCPEPTCTHNNISHALGDFGGLRKHYLRKHCTDKRHKCDNCSKAYNVETDLKCHLKVCSKKKYDCVCGERYTREYSFSIHQKSCVVHKNKNAAKHQPTSEMKEKSVMITGNKTNNTLINPQISSIFNSYPSMANYPASMGNVPPPLFSQSSTQQVNRSEYQDFSDYGLYMDVLTGKAQLQTLLEGKNNYMGDGGINYERSLSLAPTVHNTGTLNGMLNSGIQSSTINPDVGASYQTGYYGYGDGNGFGYGSGMEVFNSDTSAAIAGAGAEVGPGVGVGAPAIQNPNPYAFWF